MAARIPKQIRSLIIAELSRADGDRLSLRAIAKKYGVSLSTVQRWKGRLYLCDLPRNPDGQPGLSKFEKQVFIEISTVTRYPWRYLCEYLAPVWPSLPTQNNEQGVEFLEQLDKGENIEKVWSDATIRSLMKKHPEKAISSSIKGKTSAYKRPEAKLGVVVSHRILVEWKEQDRRIKGDLIILVERSSGLIYAKVYRGRVNARSIALCIGKMDQMIPFGISGLRFIVTRSKNSLSSIIAGRTSVLGVELELPINQENEKKFVNGVKQKLQHDMTTGSGPDDNELGIEISHDDPLTYEQQRIAIPGEFSSKKSLNLYVSELVNKINTTNRGYFSYNSFKKIAPVDQLMLGWVKLDSGGKIRSRVGSLKRSHYIKAGNKVKFGSRKDSFNRSSYRAHEVGYDGKLGCRQVQGKVQVDERN